MPAPGGMADDMSLYCVYVRASGCEGYQEHELARSLELLPLEQRGVTTPSGSQLSTHAQHQPTAPIPLLVSPPYHTQKPRVHTAPALYITHTTHILQIISNAAPEFVPVFEAEFECRYKDASLANASHPYPNTGSWPRGLPPAPSHPPHPYI